jgi:N-hydroxyarylamine O-acetyltransferase
VPLEDDTRDGRDRHRMVRQGDEWVLEAHLDGTWIALWSSMLEPAEPVDFLMGNHFVSTFPTSPFVTNLMLRAITPSGRVSVMNRAVTRRRDDCAETKLIESRAALRTLLNEDFGFDVPETERLRVPSVPEWT